MKRARTYRERADGCGAGAERVATKGRAPRDDGYASRDDKSALPDDGSTTRDDGWQRATTSRQRATTGRQLATTGPQRSTTSIGFYKKTGDNGYATPDDRYRVGGRWVVDRAMTGPTLRRHVVATMYKGGRLDRDSRSN